LQHYEAYKINDFLEGSKMIQVDSDVSLLEGTSNSNVYLLESSQGLTLVDSGVVSDADQIVDQIQAAGHASSELRSIVLTHAHADHIGSAAELVKRSGAKVMAHQIDAPYIEKTSAMPAASLSQRVMLWLGEKLLFRTPPCKVDVLLDDGDLIDGTNGFRVIHTPGHTPGSISLYQPERRILLCGDALFNANPITGKPGLRLPIRMFTVDNRQALETVRNLARLEVEVLCCGHGKPITENAGEAIRSLLRDGLA
jgi:glyoxylase-like metal-dependent hydrolase (beta-lactamase superfamily II)